ncbi:MAG: hypothetical protein LBU82_08250 [Treponema sp.]|jgi:hypothetical protein|nr:hypothetical protein [Treponema sp.]
MGGFLFRFGDCLKGKGEQWKCDWLTRLGLRIREFVLTHGVIENGKLILKIK